MSTAIIWTISGFVAWGMFTIVGKLPVLTQLLWGL